MSISTISVAASIGKLSLWSYLLGKCQMEYLNYQPSEGKNLFLTVSPWYNEWASCFSSTGYAILHYAEDLIAFLLISDTFHKLFNTRNID